MHADKVGRQRKAVIFALSAVFLWSSVATAFKLTLASVTPFQLVFYASAASTLLFAVVLVAQGRLRLLARWSLKNYVRSALMGLLNPFLYYVVLFSAYARLLGQEALALNYVWPMVLVLLSIPLLGIRVKFGSFVALLVSFAGVVVIASRGDLAAFKLSDPLGIVLALGSSLIWAFYWLLNLRDEREDRQRREDRDNVSQLLANFFFGTLYSFGLALATGLRRPTLAGLAGVVYVGFFEMGLTFLLWLKALGETRSPALISNLVYISPFVSLVFLRFILGEQLLLSTFVGLVLIVGGIGLQQIFSQGPRAAQ